MLANLIRSYALAAATAGDWAAVAAALNASTVQKTSAGTLTSMSRTLGALQASEREPTLAAFATTRVGESGLAKLAATGLDFAHPITIGLIESLRNTLPVGVADKLLKLGNWTVSPAADAGLDPVSALDCQKAWIVDGCRTEINALAAKVTAVNAWLDALDLSTKTVQELQAYCDALLASETGNP